MQTKSYHQQILKPHNEKYPCGNNTRAPKIWQNVAKQKIGAGGERGGYFWGCEVILFISEKLIFLDMTMIVMLLREEKVNERKE